MAKSCSQLAQNPDYAHWSSPRFIDRAKLIWSVLEELLIGPIGPSRSGRVWPAAVICILLLFGSIFIALVVDKLGYDRRPWFGPLLEVFLVVLVVVAFAIVASALRATEK
jgi:hypothetical protein